MITEKGKVTDCNSEKLQLPTTPNNPLYQPK